MSPLPPELSVIVLVGPRRDRAERMLASLLDQGLIDRMEVLLVDSCAGSPLAGADHGAVRTLVPPPGAHYGEMRALGVREARAPVVAFLEEHCVAYPEWARVLIETHAGPWAGVGCEVHSLNPGEGSADAIYFCGYGVYAPPAERREMNYIPGQNSSYKRELLLRYGAALADLLLNDALLQNLLRREGHKLLLEPRAKIGHRNEIDLITFAIGNYLYHRAYVPRRVRLLNWSVGKRLLYLLAMPAFPAFRLWRALQFALGAQPSRLPPLLRALPAFLLSTSFAAAGFALGLLCKSGPADLRFTHYELAAVRERDQDGARCP